ncbi:MAG: succinate dehydrogenase, cytochrome b556 subunit [Bacillota bacterium]|nr:MAG: succinate dehydrogenase, cytochrome b556 subunit [Bacillota bacterium]
MYQPVASREVRYGDLDLWPTRLKTGFWAWLLHRITGLLMVFYLFLHIIVISSVLWGTGSFDAVMDVLKKPVFAAGEMLLVSAVIYHGLNGIRVILFDVGIGIKNQKALFWAAFALAVVGFFWALKVFWPLIFG